MRRRSDSRFTDLLDLMQPPQQAVARASGLERWVIQVLAGLLAAGAASGFFLLKSEWGSPLAVAPPQVAGTVAGVTKSDALAATLSPRGEIARASNKAIGQSLLVRSAGRPSAPAENESPASIVARRWALLTTDLFDTAPTKLPPTRVVALESPPRRTPGISFMPERPFTLAPEGEAKTALVEFETAPFPYDGTTPGSDRPFLDAGEAGRRGHTNFRGHVLWEAETFSDSHVLLHIPPGFDPNRPAVMIVFFHGHGANLARDVRDRQQVPAQISASGVNAVLVAPQFAFNAADSSAGKFWEPGGFKRFLDEAARELARLDGDPQSVAAFANMPIVIVAYSGGYGPTLSVLDHGGVKTRIRGIVMLDALYSGMGKFASWIASNRSGFFVSSFTPHNRGRNAELEDLLNERSVAYESELHKELPGSVTFLPAGDISHRDFVNHAWTDSPLKDILVRLDALAPKIDPAAPALATASVTRRDQ
jgi:hypothetical protein